MCLKYYHKTPLSVPVGLCLMRKRKGLSTVTQGGEERANKMAAKHKSKHVRKKIRLETFKGDAKWDEGQTEINNQNK